MTSIPAPAVCGLLAVAPLLAACGGGGDAGPAEAVVRDSAGIAVVENPGAAVEEAARWDAGDEPLVDIGTLDGDPAYQLSGVSDVEILSDGTLVVAHDDPPELRFYDAEGRHLRTAGGEGEGPGEFQRVGPVLRLAGDTLLAYDLSQRRLSRFGPDGQFLGSFRLDSEGFGSLVGRLDDGTLVVEALAVFGAGGSAAEGTERRDSPLLTFGPDGAFRDTLVVRPGGQFQTGASGERVMMVPIPFSTEPEEAVGSQVVYTAHSRAWEIRALEPTGRLRRIVRLDRERRPLTRAAWDDMVDRRTGDIDDPAMRRWQEEMYRAMPVPERLPAFDDMRLDAAGNLWLREPGAEASGAEGTDRWIVFGPEGRVRAVARLPSGFQPLDLGTETVAGRWTDELDVPHVRVYRLDKRGPGSEG